MTDRVSTCSAGENVDRAMSLMAQEQVRRIPIVDERGNLVESCRRLTFYSRATTPEKPRRRYSRSRGDTANTRSDLRW
jgi:CBS domain.